MKTKPPSTPDTLVSPRVASELTGVPLARLMKALDAGKIRYETKRGKMYISLSDVEEHAGE